MGGRTVVAVVSGFVVCVLGGVAQARPGYKGALSTFVGPSLAPKLNDCRTCHTRSESDGPSAVNGRTLNAFGTRLQKALPELRAAKKRAGIRNRLEAIADEDSDGDGAPNLVELRSGHFPGDASDKPSAQGRE